MNHDFITICNKTKLKRINLSELYAIEGDSYSTTFILKNQDSISCAKTLKEIETLLPSSYLRISKNILINLEKLVEVNFDDRIVLLKNSKEYNVSIRKIRELKKLFK